VLKDRAQLTFTGDVLFSAISQDGKQLAYWTRHCKGASCTYGVSVQDIGGTTSRQIFDGATSAYGIEWSPDRRNLIVAGSIDARSGYFLLSALGGPPRFLTSSAATFWAGGDSLLVARPYGAGDSVHFVRVSSLDGTVADSIRVAGAGFGITGLSVQPAGKWIVAVIIQKGRGFWQVFDRQGKVADHVTNSCTCPGIISGSALFLQRQGIGFESIVRVGLDRESGRLASHQDTLYSGPLNGFSVTADGSTMVIDDGASDYSVFALDLPEAMRGQFPDSRRVMHSSTGVDAEVSPDGKLLLAGRLVTGSTGKVERRYSIMNFDGTNERPLGGAVPRAAAWTDPANVIVATQTPGGLHAALVDARTGAMGLSIDIPDSTARAVHRFSDGWAWIPPTRDRVVLRRGDKLTEIARPKGAGRIDGFDVDRTGTRIVMESWSATMSDSMTVSSGPTQGGALEPWITLRLEDGRARFLPDGSLVFVTYPTAESAALWRLRAPGKAESMGTVMHPLGYITVSDDLKRAAVQVVDYHGDAWLSKVVRP